ncbi:MAG: hypothetical protein KAH91_05630, partial [Thermoplasmatales archaeon]|nr:hypothetical protein [Thermoplasmatales archaeon]
MGLLEKARQMKQIEKKEDSIKIVESPITEKTEKKRKEITTEKKDYTGVKVKGKKQIIEEKKGFGRKGLGTRRIVFNQEINEYVYELSEPTLSEDEKETKEELTRLFKMLADVNITNMFKEEKEKYLGDTLEQIIEDNDIKFGEKKHKKTKEEDENLGLFKKSKKKAQTEETENKKPEKNKKSLKKLFSKK